MDHVMRARPILAVSLSLVFAASSASASALAEKSTAPKPWLRAVIDRALSLSKKRVEPGTESESKWRDEAKALIDDTLDWPEMTEQAIGRDWKNLSEPQKKEFSTLLREMIEASYQSKLKLVARGQVKKPESVKIEWLDEKQEGNDATITARAKTEKNVAVFEFKMKQHSGRWRIWDVSIDDVSTVRTYRTQFAKIKAKDGFDALLARMRTKTEEIRAGKGELGP
jgi:phospholipid transport system substrate-binding protein